MINVREKCEKEVLHCAQLESEFKNFNFGLAIITTYPGKKQILKNLNI
jgi:hypothetical protein